MKRHDNHTFSLESGCVKVIVIKNEPGDPSSNNEQVCLHFDSFLCLWEKLEFPF